jgi:hypothetical protein
MSTRMEIDHVLIGVTDLGPSAAAVEKQLGVTSVEGGRHPAWGTANRIVPLGDSYLELLAVVDRATASRTAFGRWVVGGASERGRPIGWAVRVDDIEAQARRLGLTVSPGSRARPDGRIIRWRTTGIEAAAADPSLPFFIQWSDETDLPGRLPLTDTVDQVRLARLVIDGDADRIGTWLGDHRMPVDVRPGHSAIAQVVLDHGGTLTTF